MLTSAIFDEFFSHLVKMIIKRARYNIRMSCRRIEVVASCEREGEWAMSGKDGLTAKKVSEYQMKQT